MMDIGNLDLGTEDIKELNDSLESTCIKNLLFEIIKREHKDLMYDPDFIMLDKALEFEDNFKIFNELLLGYQKKFISDGVLPDIEDVHEKLVEIVSVNDEFLKGLTVHSDYDLDFTKKFLARVRIKFDDIYSFIREMGI